MRCPEINIFVQNREIRDQSLRPDSFIVLF